MHFNSWLFNLTAKKEGHSVALICTYPVIWFPHIFCMCLPRVSVHFCMELVLFRHRSYLFNYYY